jgi:hypothetical protein
MDITGRGRIRQHATKEPEDMSIASMKVHEKVTEAIQRSIPRLPGATGELLASLLSPETLAIVSGTLIAWAGSHLSGVGEVVDLILLALGAVALGSSVLDVASHIGSFCRLAVNATSERELDEAANHLAKAITIAGVDVVTAILLRRTIRDVRARPSWRPSSPGLLRAGPPPDMRLGRVFARPKISRPVKLPDGVLGTCDFYGNISVVRTQTVTEQQLTLYHELVHSVLSPRLRVFRQFRADLKASGYWRSAILRYLEEALAESYAQLKIRGVSQAFRALTFPIGEAPYGYVTVSELASEGAALGSIAVGGYAFRVHLAERPPTGTPEAVPND